MIYKLDSKDKRILHELDYNARQSNNQIGKKVKLSKEVIKYRVDRMIENGIIIRFHTIINYFKLGIIKYKLYLRLTNTDKNKIEEIVQYFNENKKTEWVAVLTGRWDIIIGFLVHNVNEFDDEVQTVLNKFSNYIQEKAVTTTVYLVHSYRSFLKNENKEIERIVYHTSKDKQENIDEIDNNILRILTNNGRLPITEIANKLKLTPRIIQYRVKELEKKKIILAYKVHIEPKALEKIFCKVILYLGNITQNRLKTLINYVSSLDGVIWPQRVMGSWDLEIDFEIDNYDKFQAIILDLKEKFSDIIKNHEFCIVSKEYKLDLYPNSDRTYK